MKYPAPFSLLLFLLTFCSVLSAPGAAEVIFESDFEFGETLSWSSSTSDTTLPLDGGGSLLLRDGVLEPGATVDVRTVPMPDLPPGIQAFGDAIVIDIDPPLRFPARLRLPRASPAELNTSLAKNDKVDVVIEVPPSGDPIILQTEEKGAVVETSVLETNHTFIAAQIADEDLFAVTLTVEPQVATMGETVLFLVRIRTRGPFWPRFVVIFYGDGGEEEQTFPIFISDTEIDFLYQYFEPKRYKLLASLRSNSSGGIGIGGRLATAVGSVRVLKDPRGLWQSQFGEIDFDRSGTSLTGLFLPGQNGIITGQLSGRTLEGFWVESFSAQDCDSEMNDNEGLPSDNWGRVRFEFNEDFTEFCGKWDHCEDEPSNDWNGWRELLPSCP